MAVPRCETGIAELDQVLRGGIPRGNLVLLAGSPGTGKTTLASEFLCHGASRGERGLLISAVEPLAVLERNLREYQFFDARTLADGTLQLAEFGGTTSSATGATSLHGQAFVARITALLDKAKAQRVVLDSLTALCQRLGSATEVRDFVFGLGEALRKAGCTAIVVSATPPRELRYSVFGVEEAIADGILFLSELERHNDLVRTLQVIKMGGTDHSRAKFMMDLSGFGISLAPLLKKFGDTSG